MPARDLDWPPELHPATAPVFTHNEIYIPSDPDRIWAQLIRATDWPEVYSYAYALHFEDDTGPDLTPDAELSWRSFGVRVAVFVTQFEPPYRLAWHGSRAGSHGYHGWVIDPVNDGCRVISQTTQSGLLPSLGRVVIRRLLRRSQKRWLEQLAKAVADAEPI